MGKKNHDLFRFSRGATLLSFLISCRRHPVLPPRLCHSISAAGSPSLSCAQRRRDARDRGRADGQPDEPDIFVLLRARQRHRGELQRRRRLVTAATSTTPSSLAGSAMAPSLSHHCREERRLRLTHLLGPEKLTVAIAIAGRSTRPYSSRQSGSKCIAWKGIKLRSSGRPPGSIIMKPPTYISSKITARKKQTRVQIAGE